MPICRDTTSNILLKRTYQATLAPNSSQITPILQRFVPAGKLNHSGSDQLSGSAYSLVDYNRAGQALLEIVSEPDMRSGQDAAAYGAELRRIMVFLGVSDGEMSVSFPLNK